MSNRTAVLSLAVSFMVLTTLALVQGAGGAPQAGSIVGNGILQNPAAVADSSGEWFEPYNPTAAPIDINGWTLRDDDIDSHVIAAGSLLVLAMGYVVLGNNANAAVDLFNDGSTALRASDHDGLVIFLRSRIDGN